MGEYCLIFSGLYLWTRIDGGAGVHAVEKVRLRCSGVAEVTVRVVLRLSGEADVEGGSLKTVTLSDRDFFIGRDLGCDWIVSDKLRMMSRRHCSLKKQGDAVLLTDLSSNGTSIGSPGNRLVQGQPTPLPDTAVIYLGGEHVRIDYECHLEEATAETPDDDFWGVNEIKRSRGQNQPKRLPADDDLNLFADEAPDRNDALSLALDAEPERSAMNDLSLDDGPIAPQPVREAPTPQPSPDRMTFSTPQASAADDIFSVDDANDADEDDPFADLSGGRGALKNDGADALSLEDPEPVSVPHEEPEIVRPPKAYPAASVPNPQAAAVRQGQQHPTTVFPIQEAPRQARTQSDVQPSVQTATTPPTNTTETDRTLAALFATLGIALEEVPPEKRHEMAAEIGRSFRALADGMRELLASRRDVKIALGLGATQIETGSNPLKFSRDANDAVNALLRPSATGFLTGSTAVSDAVTALQQHQVALVGGVKASMKTALATFDPDEIEKKLTKRGVSQIIPMKRKAELWEKFVENYKDFASEADEDIRRVIGKQLEQLYADEATRSRAALNL